MAKTTEITPVQQVAQTFYRWYLYGEVHAETLEAVQAFLGSSISVEDLRQVSERLRGDESFMARQAPLVSRWQARMEAGGVLSETEAQSLIQEIFDSFDHALLFDQGVTAGSTLTRRGEISDSDLTMPGKMPCWTLHYTVGGRALFLNEQIEAVVQRGHLMLLRPDAHYHYGLHPGADHWEHLWALFQPRAHWQEWLGWKAMDTNIQYLELAGDAECELVEGLFRQLIQLQEHAGPYRNDLQMNKLEEILIHSAECSIEKGTPSIDRRVRQACEFMQAHLTEKFSIEDVADACNLSPSRLSHLFKQQMGVGPKAWVNNARLQKARQLLLSSTESIGGIATRIGYEDPGQFTKYFRKNLGCSPRDFRRSFARLD